MRPWQISSWIFSITIFVKWKVWKKSRTGMSPPTGQFYGGPGWIRTNDLTVISRAL